MQEVVDLTDPDAPLKLDDDGMLALQIALDLDESTAVIAEIRDQIKEKLDPGGKGALTREAWRIVSAEWHASGKSFLDFITTSQQHVRELLS